MPFSFESTAGRADRNPGGLSRILGRTKLLAALLSFALLPHPVPILGSIPSVSYGALLSWNPSPSPTVAGYHLYYGTASGIYTANLVLGNLTSTTVAGLSSGVTYYFAMTSYDANGVESSFSNEASFVPGTPALQLLAASAGQVVVNLSGQIGSTYAVQASQDLMTWTTIGTVTIGAGGASSFTDINAANFPQRFYRTQAEP